MTGFKEFRDVIAGATLRIQLNDGSSRGCDAACSCADVCAASQRCDEDRLMTGFKECRDVTVRFLVEHGEDAVGPLCTALRLHLHDHLRNTICSLSAGHQSRPSAHLPAGTTVTIRYELLLSPRKRGIVFLPALVCLSVCLSVCMFVCYHDN